MVWGELGCDTDAWNFDLLSPDQGWSDDDDDDSSEFEAMAERW